MLTIRNKTNKTCKACMTIIIAMLAAFCGLAAAASTAQATPPMIADNFYGEVSIDEKPAAIGTDVVVFSQGKICGRYVVKMEGKYGMMNCNSDRLEDAYFEVNGEKADAKYLTRNNVNLMLDSPVSMIPKDSEAMLMLILLAAIAYLIWKEKKRRL